jgi:hypothetical protein
LQRVNLLFYAGDSHEVVEVFLDPHPFKHKAPTGEQAHKMKVQLPQSLERETPLVESLLLKTTNTTETFKPNQKSLKQKVNFIPQKIFRRQFQRQIKRPKTNQLTKNSD